MAISNYTLATKPYTRGYGDKTTTVVEIRLQEGNRYSTNQLNLSETALKTTKKHLSKRFLTSLKLN